MKVKCFQRSGFRWVNLHPYNVEFGTQLAMLSGHNNWVSNVVRAVQVDIRLTLG